MKELKKAGGGGGGGAKFRELTALPGQVLAGLKFLGSGSKEVQTGTCPNRSLRGDSPGYSTDSPSVPAHLSDVVNWTKDTAGNDVAALSPPRGQYPGGTGAYVTCEPDELGITPDKIGATESIGPVQGTYGSDANLEAKNLLVGKTGYGPNGKVTGTMQEKGEPNQTLDAGGEYSIQEGHYSGGKIKAKDLKSQTSGTAAAGDIRDGKTAYVNGVKVTGTLGESSPANRELAAGGSVTYAAGIKNNGWTVTAKDLESQTSATAAAAQILKGFTAWVNGLKITGTMKKAVDSKKTNLSSSDNRAVIQQTRQASGDARVWAIKNADNTNRLCILNPVAGYWADNDVLGVTFANVATALGLTAAKIKKGESVCGVDGSCAVLTRNLYTHAIKGYGASSNVLSAEESYTMPRAGVIYYGMSINGYGNSPKGKVELIVNGTTVNSVELTGEYSAYAYSFAEWQSHNVNANDTVKIKCTITQGTHVFGMIGAHFNC